MTSQISKQFDQFDFDFEAFVRDDLKIASRDVCQFYLKGFCQLGKTCPQKHVKRRFDDADKTIVCKHWLRNLCKKGDGCEYLHEFNMEKMPECFFFSKYKECSNQECFYRHVDPNAIKSECTFYNRGFCNRGGFCRNLHLRRFICPMYLCGFCPMGPNCKMVHPKYVPDQDKDFQDHDYYDNQPRGRGENGNFDRRTPRDFSNRERRASRSRSPRREDRRDYSPRRDDRDFRDYPPGPPRRDYPPRREDRDYLPRDMDSRREDRLSPRDNMNRGSGDYYYNRDNMNRRDGPPPYHRDRDNQYHHHQRDDGPPRSRTSSSYDRDRRSGRR